MCCTASISALIDVSLLLPNAVRIRTSEVALLTSHRFLVVIMPPLGASIDAAHMVEGNAAGEMFACERALASCSFVYDEVRRTNSKRH